MSLTSPLFIFICLPIMMAIYAFVPRMAKRHAIAVFSVIFYIIANIENPFSLVLLVLTVCAVYFVTRFVDGLVGHKRAAVTAVAVGVLVSIFLALRISDSLGINLLHIRYPFGASVWLLCAISCIVDVKRGDAPPPSVVDTVFYITYFPVMAVGPIIRYKDSADIFKNADFSFSNIAKGAEFFMLGFVKLYAIASVLFEMLQIMHLNLSAGIGVLSVFEYVLIVPLIAYSFFSGYSDMAVGISQMFGFSLNRDFSVVLFASSPVKYFEGFMSSLHVYFEDYLGHIFRKIGAERAQSFLSCAAILCAVAFWFDSEPLTFICLIPVALLAAIFCKYRHRPQKNVVIRAFCCVGTLAAVSVIWGFIMANNSFEAFSFVADFIGNLGGFKSLLVFGGVSLSKYAITFLTVVLVLGVFDRAVSSKKSSATRALINCGLLLVFIFTLFFWFVQFPGVENIF